MNERLNPTDSGERLPFFGAPPARTPQPARTVPTLTGKRVVLSTPDGFVYDMRAISQIHRDGGGADVIEIATEEDYFRWMFTHIPPPSNGYPARLVWVE